MAARVRRSLNLFTRALCTALLVGACAVSALTPALRRPMIEPLILGGYILLRGI